MKAIKRTLVVAVAIAVAGIASGPAPRSAAQGTRPNIVLIMSDDQDFASLPVMRKLLAFPEGSWVKFSRFFINASICCPSRATVLTGQYSHHTGVLGNSSGNKLDDSNTLAVWLDRVGYQTALIGKYLNDYPWDRGTNYTPSGWDVFHACCDADGPSYNDTDKHSDEAVNFIKSAKQPFFLYQAYKAPHAPAAFRVPARYKPANYPNVYIPPDPPNLNEADVSDKPAWIRNKPLLSQTDLNALKQEREDGQRSLLAVDDGVARIVDAIKAKGALNNTVVLYMSDNGYSFGSHRNKGKFCVYEEASHVPLLIRYPGLAANRVESSVVSNVDLASTISQIAGVTPGLPQDGSSLVGLLTGSATQWPNEVLLEKASGGGDSPKYYAIRTANWKYVEYSTGEKELYDLGRDPYELENHAGDPAYNDLQADLAARLKRLKGS
jgi:N-acetylglucosamine-6-sulfatase